VLYLGQVLVEASTDAKVGAPFFELCVTSARHPCRTVLLRLPTKRTLLGFIYIEFKRFSNNPFQESQFSEWFFCSIFNAGVGGWVEKREGLRLFEISRALPSGAGFQIFKPTRPYPDRSVGTELTEIRIRI
jgi:hypothetical protein